MNDMHAVVNSGTAGGSGARRRMVPGSGKAGGAVRGGFTLMELLVVVAIIVLLIAILLPSLSMVKQRARHAQTQSLMTHLAANIDAYYERFRAYPGPIGAAQTTAANNKISGTQNMLLGLTYTVTQTASGMPIPGAGSWYVKTGGAPAAPMTNGPMDYGVIKPDGSAEQLAPYFEPSPNQAVSITQINTGFGGVNNFPLPVVVDSFGDALPILYYRRTPGVENTVAANRVANPGDPNPPGYYFDENKEYTNPAGGILKAVNGTPCPQNTNSGGTVSKFDQGDLNKLVSVDNTTNGKVRGNYVLISAGVDRAFGTRTISGNLRPSDDIVIVRD